MCCLLPSILVLFHSHRGAQGPAFTKASGNPESAHHSPPQAELGVRLLPFPVLRSSGPWCQPEEQERKTVPQHDFGPQTCQSCSPPAPQLYLSTQDWSLNEAPSASLLRPPPHPIPGQAHILSTRGRLGLVILILFFFDLGPGSLTGCLSSLSFT